MKLFRKKKDEESFPAGTPAEDELSVREGEDPEAETRSEVSHSAGDEEALSEATDQSPPSDTPDQDFFDLPPEQVAGYVPKGLVAAAPRDIDFRPVLNVLIFIVIIAAIVTGIYLVWPSSTARVPDLVGKSLTEAMDNARSRGFQPLVTTWNWSASRTNGVVLSQEPVAARVVKKGATISLNVSKGPQPETGSKTPISAAAPASSPAAPYSGKVICVDPGGQTRTDASEWTDPGMTRKNTPEPDVRGTVTGNAEYLVNLDIGVKLKNLLEKDGIKVVMTRETNDVDLSNIMRAEIASNANANLYLRIHCANSDDPMVMGAQTLYPAQGDYTEPIYEKSKQAALLVQAELLKSLGVEDKGVVSNHDLPGLNWSKVPVIQAEPGYLSSPRDDSNLAEDSYRWKVAWGLRNGIIKYLTSP